MGWPLDVSSVGVATTFLSLFMLIFMLLSTFFTSRIFLGTAPVAMIVGTIFGPEALAVFEPANWSQSRTVALEFSRIVLALQSFGNAVELPRDFLRRQWVSLAYIIGPVMLGGWLVMTCCVKFMVPSFDWRQALACAACFNAIDPVLAATVLSGRFSEHVPMHTRNLLRLEAAANGLTSTVILSMTANLLTYRHDARKVAAETASFGLAYGSIFSAFAGTVIGYTARLVARRAHQHDTIDRPSFLAYYLSVALLSTGFGALIGVDEVNLAFFAGVGLDDDNWYEDMTRETFLSSCIDLMLNLSYFAYIGSMVPWKTFNSEDLGLMPWRLVVGTLLIFLFRRVPFILALKSLIPYIFTWREALFYGHFGPIGAGALFSALQITERLTDVPESSSSATFMEQLWTICMFVVVCSTIVHGTSVAIFSFGKWINTMHITLTYTTADPNGSTWLDRLSRIDSRTSSQTVEPNESQEVVLEGSSPQAAAPAVAYQFGNTVIVEDEEGVVIRKYDLSPRQFSKIEDVGPSRTAVL